MTLSIDGIIQFYDTSVDNGTITGVGKNPWLAKVRLCLMKEILIIAKRLIKQDKIDWACCILKRAFLRCDNDTQPPDFIEGPSVFLLNEMISQLITELGCE